MKLELAEIIPYALAALTGAVGWGWREVQSLRKAHHDHKTHVAEKYVTKEDLRDDLTLIHSALKRIEAKVDRNT